MPHLPQREPDFLLDELLEDERAAETQRLRERQHE